MFILIFNIIMVKPIHGIFIIILILLPLVISKKSEKASKSSSEWDKIKEYGKKINDKTRNQKN